jgi:hypothetical protein
MLTCTLVFHSHNINIFIIIQHAILAPIISHGQVGPKRAREMWFLSRFYTADEADKMGLVNTVVPVSAENQS